MYLLMSQAVFVCTPF